MRRKARIEKQVEHHNNQLLRLEEQLIQLEASMATAQVFRSMKSANEATRANLRNARMEEQLIQLEAPKATAEVFHSMKNANEATRANLRNARMEESGQVLDNVQETQDETSEINEALCRPINFATEADDDALSAELAEMDYIDTVQQFIEIGPVVTCRKEEERVVQLVSLSLAPCDIASLRSLCVILITVAAQRLLPYLIAE